MTSMDLEKLETDLVAMVEEDNLYWTKNDAKFRAAKQHVSYEEFDKIVKAAHLKPLEKGDNLVINQNSSQLNKSPGKIATKVYRPSTNISLVHTKKSRNDDRNMDTKSKSRKSRLVCTTEIVDLVSRLNEEIHWEVESDVNGALTELIEISRRPRFQLEWSWASKDQKRQAAKLVMKVEQYSSKCHEVKELSKLFDVKASE